MNLGDGGSMGRQCGSVTVLVGGKKGRKRERRGRKLSAEKRRVGKIEKQKENEKGGRECIPARETQR